MRKFRFLLLFVFVIAAGAIAVPAQAAGWISRPSGTQSPLYDVYIGANEVLAVGGSGVILRSTNDGLNWSNIAHPDITASLRGVDKGWAVGINGARLLKAGATSWTIVSSGGSSSSAYQDVEGYIAATAFDIIVASSSSGGAIYYTNNGGQTWSTATIPAGTPALHAIECTFVNETVPYYCWAVGDNGTILKSVNGGTAWTAQASGTTRNLHGIALADPLALLAVGDEGTVRKTANGGSLWTGVSGSVGGGGINLRDAAYSGVTGDYYVVGQTNKIYRSDTGSLWVADYTGGAAVTFEAIDIDGSRQIAVGSGGAVAVYGTMPPAAPGGINQRFSSSGAPIPAGGVETSDRAITFYGTVTDPDGDMVKLEIEVKPAGTAFVGAASVATALVNSGSTPQVDYNNIPNGLYHWQARAVDASGLTSAWVSFGGNTESAADFAVAVDTAVNTADTSPPSTPGNLTITTPSTDNTPGFGWTMSSDNVTSASRIIYEARVLTAENSEILGWTNVGDGDTTAAYVYNTPLSNGSYQFFIRAADDAGNRSPAASAVFSINVVTAVGSGSGNGGGGDSGRGVGNGGGGVTSITPPLPSGSLTRTISPPVSGGPPFTLTQMEADAQIIVQGSSSSALAILGLSELTQCQMSQASANDKVNRVFGMITDSLIQSAIINFTSCGTISTLHLGAGERLGVVNSYKSAFGRLPSTAAHWFDVIKIANGRFPGETSDRTEAAAKTRFHVIYLRAPNLNQPNDKAAVNVMAYGLRPLPRNVGSEAAAISIYKRIFGKTPFLAQEWDALRAIAYSGAKR